MDKIIEIFKNKYWEEIKKKANVVGYSKTIKNKIINGKVTDIPCIRIYVRRKIKPKKYLLPKDIIPATIEGIYTDVVEIGELRAPPDGFEMISTSKTDKFRPVKLGVSVGHWDITAGSLGMLYRYKGVEYAGSNAHVLTPNPSLPVEKITEKRILQPGAYHGGKNPDNVVGEYAWHKRIVPIGESNCKIGQSICRTMNKLLAILGRRGRFHYITQVTNNIDFAVYEPTVPHSIEVADKSLSDEPFIGHLFAGSEKVGIICKVKYIIEEGFYPLVEPTEVKDGDIVKGCSFWCNYQTIILDESAVTTVSYGDFIAEFEDVIMVKNDKVIRGGWSGSGWRKIESS